jgi:hypothetical protein
MRIGTAAKLWDKLEPNAEQYENFRRVLDQMARELAGVMELWYEPFDVGAGLAESLASPPATLLVLPNGWVKVAAALPHICADLRRDRLETAWQAYQSAWRDGTVLSSARRAMSDPTRHQRANRWELMSVANL